MIRPIVGRHNTGIRRKAKKNAKNAFREGI